MKRGFSLIELIACMFFILILGGSIVFSYLRYIEKQELKKLEISVVGFMNKYQAFSYTYGDRIEIHFDLDEGLVYKDDDRIYLSKLFKYSSKNLANKKHFVRNFTSKGNLNKGFTLLVYKKDKLVKEIAYNSIDSISYPIVRIKDYV